MNGHIEFIGRVRWSPDGEKIATASGDRTAIIWSATDGTKLFTLKGHTDVVTEINWSPDGTKVATASYDSKAIIWSASTGTELYTMIGHTHWINDISWSPDGNKIATASWDKTTKIWYASEETDVNENLICVSSNFSIFPNPTDNIFTIQFEKEITTSSNLIICNLLGQKIAESNVPIGTKEWSVPLDGIPSGMYMIKINSLVRSLVVY